LFGILALEGASAPRVLPWQHLWQLATRHWKSGHPPNLPAPGYNYLQRKNLADDINFRVRFTLKNRVNMF